MLALLGVTTLVLVAGAPGVLPAAAGGTKLKPPQNVDVNIIDETFILRWNGSSESAGNVTFSAEFQVPETMDKWIKLPGCQSITGTKCDFSSLKINVYENIQLRIRAEEGNSTSPWHELDPFIPFQQAQIGPPKVHLEAEDKAIIVNISPPGTQSSVMWDMDSLSFMYSIVVWENSGVQTRRETAYPQIKIHKLSPETTYCVKVKASLPLQRNVALYSPVHCINTTVENKLPPPENVGVTSKNQLHVLKWDYTHTNVTFQAQWLHAYLKKIPGKDSGKWTQIPNCEHVRTTQCVLPRSTFQKGIYFIRVRASSGNGTSPWSEEEKFDTERQMVIPPPALTVQPIGNSSLRVYLGSQNTSAFQHYPLTYEIIFWENTSNAETKVVRRSADVTIPQLKELTVYCVKARALLEDGARNRSSAFSDAVCRQTGPGGTPRTWLVAAVCATLTILLVLCAASALGKLISYVFFPSSKPPSTIDEYFPDQPLKNLLLFTSEEQTEKCFIIENIDTVATEETGQTDEDFKIYNSQTSQDLGNYSNEEENSGGNTGEAPGLLGPRHGLQVVGACVALPASPALASAAHCREGVCLLEKRNHLPSAALKGQASTAPVHP